VPDCRLFRLANALTVLLALAVAPFLIWGAMLDDELSSFHWSLAYLSELAPWILYIAGVVWLAPVALSTGLHPESRFYPRRRRAYFVWGIVLYLLAAGLTVEQFNLWSYAH
jgi:hypothetical protein